MRQKEVVGLLRALADWLERASSDEMRALVEGSSRFCTEEAGEEKYERGQTQVPAADLATVMRRLESAQSTEEGLQILMETRVDRSRSELQYLARHYEVSIRKSERLGQFATRIVQAVVGSKVQSEITKSLSLSRDQPKF